MSIPTTFAPIKKSDFTLTPLKVHKQFEFSSSALENTGSGYNLVEGCYTKLITPIESPQAANDPINSSDGSYKHIIWKHIDHMYYRDPYNPFNTFEHSNERYTQKILNYSASMLSIPYMDYGERIKKNTVKIINDDLDITLYDDGNGNLYDIDITTESIFTRSSVIGYWGFNDQFRKFKYLDGYIESDKYYYKSYTFSPGNYPSIVNNVYFEDGPEIYSTGSGMSAKFDGTGGYILTPHHDQFDFEKNEEFSIAFWIKPLDTGSGALITKNGVEWQIQKGKHDRILNSGGGNTIDTYYSSSFVDSLVNHYPYDFTYDSGSIIFKRSDGIHTVNITGSISVNDWNHMAVTRFSSGSKYYMKMFTNGTGSLEYADDIIQPANNHAMMFGARNQNGLNSFYGNLDEIRFLSEPITDFSEYCKVENMYATNIVGNAFYRQGNIVISSLYPKYKNMLNGSWNIEYKGTHTIYQYEVLCRIKKGDFNLTLNPSARKSSKSDQLIDEFTGSAMTPYFTTIGLYNDTGDLVAIAKMGQPIKSREDVDISVLVRWDS